VVLYSGIEAPVLGPNGNYIEFIDSQSGLTVAIKSLGLVNTNIPNSKSMKIMAVGAGEFYQDGSTDPVGPANLSLTGK
jgi:hypothetical protein